MRMIQYPSRNFEKWVSSTHKTPEAIRHAVEKILGRVQRSGDQALIAMTRQWDGVRLSPRSLRISEAKLRVAKVTPKLERAARSTLKEVQRFAQASLPKNWSRLNGHGARVGEKFDPLRRVGIYIPGGSVPLLSTVFMTVALARVAGVKEIVVCTPPPVAEPLLWALNLCKVTEVYQLGGAQAMAAMAYGTQTIRPVDKLFGPGNAYVTEAKRQLFGVVGVDLLAGPSELMVLADESTQVDWAAADLLAQAEHGSGYERIFCISSSRKVLEQIMEKLRDQSAASSTNQGLQKVLKDGTWFIQTKSRNQLIEVANRLAPEHLQIMTRSPEKLARAIYTVGGIFLGNDTPTVIGDFVAGPSHTLPTAGAGRAFSGLRVTDFLRRTSVIQYSRAALVRAAKGVEAFAEVESLPYHGNSLRVRLG